MTSTLLVSQAEAPEGPPAEEMEPLQSASPGGRLRYLTRLEASGLALLPRAGLGAEEGFAQVEPTLTGTLGPLYAEAFVSDVLGARLLGADAVTTTLDMTLRLEVRTQRGGFRQGYFGPDYELARFRAVGPEGVPLAEVPFPDGFSLYAEAVVGWDSVRYGGLQKHLQLSLAAEAFTWGRFDVDGRMGLGVDNAL